jgi:dTDP-4-dehydrorhamnose reductase
MTAGRVLVTGGGGQLAAEFVEVYGDAEVWAPGHDALDVTDADAVAAAVERERPDLVIHCAAYTDVDGAESAREQAFHVNERGTREVARAAAGAGAGLVVYSSDYVFAGDAPGGYAESDAVGPQSVYGASKLAGEQAARAEHLGAYVVRTAWVFGPRGKNFVRTILRLAQERDTLRIVDDQRGCPTYTRHLAEATRTLVERCPSGTYHLAGGGACSWRELAQAIVDEAGLRVAVEPITSAELNRPAPRPACSVLRSEHACTPALPPWREGLTACLRRIEREDS